MKIKNKKLFALLMLPAVIAMMVLPLCSFTTVYNSDFDRYSSLTDIGLCYNYNYGTTGTYRGVLNDCGTVLMSGNTHSARINSIKFSACDYYITSSSRISISKPTRFGFDDDTWITSFDDDDGQFFNYDYRLSLLYSSNNTNTYFPLEFYFDNYRLDDDIGFWLIKDGNLFSLSGKYISLNIEFDINYLYVSPDGYISFSNTHMSETEMYGLHDYPSFYVENYVQAVWQRYHDEGLPDNICDLTFYQIDNLHFDLTVQYDNGIEIVEFSDVDCLILMSNIMAEYKQPSFIDDSLFALLGDDTMFENGYKQGYKLGLVNGKNIGLNSAPVVWGNIGNFLTNTVGSFFSFELWDGFTLGGVMAIFVGAMLFVAFLKVFAGG